MSRRGPLFHRAFSHAPERQSVGWCCAAIKGERMGLFSRRKEPASSAQMAGYRPLDIANREDAARRLADTFWNEPLQVRNEFANGLLAWAETQGVEDFDLMKTLVLDTEYAMCVKEWTRKDPTMDGDLAAAKLQVLMLEMVRATAEPKANGDNYHASLGADIPLIVRSAFENLYEAHQLDE